MADDWTMSTLHLYLDRQIADLRKSTDDRFVTAERAVANALAASDKAVAAALAAQKEAASKAETSAEARHLDLVRRLDTTANGLSEKIAAIAIRVEGMAGSGRGIDKAWGYLAAAAGVAVAIVSVVTR